MRLTRRNFLKGLLSSVAAAALVKNGVVQPEQVLAEPERKVFDMGANTWRRQWTVMQTTWNGHLGHAAVWDRELSAAEMASLADVPFHVNCRCTLTDPLQITQELLDDSCSIVFTKPWMTGWTGWGITDEQVRTRINELKAGARSSPRGLLSQSDINDLRGQA